MNKKILILSSIIGLMLIVWLILFFLNNKKQLSTPIPTEEKITITTSGNKVAVDNYYKAAENIIDEKDVILKKNDDYTIAAFNYSEGRSFLISIQSLTKDPKAVRKDAENYFITSLGITQDQACLLNVSESVSKDIDENLAGQDFGLSFCPNGKPFYNSQK